MRITLFFAITMGLTTLSGCTPKLGEEHPIDDLWNNAELDGKYVTTTGIVGLSVGIMGSSSCDRTSCTLRFSRPEDVASAHPGTHPTGTLRVQVGNGENEMAELPDKYSKEDLKIKAMGGKVLKHGDTMKVTGKLRCKLGAEPSLPCTIDVSRFDVP